MKILSLNKRKNGNGFGVIAAAGIYDHVCGNVFGKCFFLQKKNEI